MSFSEIEDWWNEWQEENRGWAVFDKPSPALFTTYYAQMVVEGDILASKEVKQACKRHLMDLDRQGTEKFPWVFNEDRAWRPIRFIEQKCKPSKGGFKKLILQL